MSAIGTKRTRQQTRFTSRIAVTGRRSVCQTVRSGIWATCVRKITTIGTMALLGHFQSRGICSGGGALDGGTY